MKTLETTVPGEMIIETFLTTKEVTIQQEMPANTGPMDSPPDDWIPGELQVRAWLTGLDDAPVSEASEIFRAARAWFGLMRSPDGVLANESTIAILRLVPVS